MLVGFERSGVVRRAFRELGHSAYSCDLVPADDNSPHHLTGDVRHFLRDDWDMAVFHPPCTAIAVSGARWFKTKERAQDDALRLILELWDCPIPKVCIENPVGIIPRRLGLPASQYVQPWWFGDGFVKKTGLWLRGLPLLVADQIVDGRDDMIHRMPPSPDRGRLRSVTFPGLARAMAEQWGSGHALALLHGSGRGIAQIAG